MMTSENLKIQGDGTLAYGQPVEHRPARRGRTWVWAREAGKVLVRRTKAAADRWLSARRTRRWLEEASDATLKDVGLSRVDVYRELRRNARR